MTGNIERRSVGRDPLSDRQENDRRVTSPEPTSASRGSTCYGLIVALVVLAAAACQPAYGPVPTQTAQQPRATGSPAPAATTQPVAQPTPRQVADQLTNKRGLHLLLDDGNVQFPVAVWDSHLSWASRLSGDGGYVVQLIRSSDLNPMTWQRFFDAAARERLIPIVRIATIKDPSGNWWVAPTPDPGGLSYRGEARRWRTFFESIRWRAGGVIVTVGNETNRADEWAGAADPEAYARYLRDIAEALREVSTVDVQVLNGALDAYAPSTPMDAHPSMDSERYLEEMERAVPGILGSLDGWASHAYPLGPFNSHPRLQEFRIDDVRRDPPPRQRPPAGLANRGINSYAWELWKLRQLGVNREYSVYVTETGWRHERSQQAGAADSLNATVSDHQMEQYLELAFDGPDQGSADGWIPWNDDPRVSAVVLFALGGRPEIWGHTNLVHIAQGGQITGAHSFANHLPTMALGRIDCAVAPSC